MKSLKAIIAATLSVAAVSTPALADFTIRWMEHSDAYVRANKVVDLGSVRLGDEFRRVDSDVIDIRNNPRMECNLSHIKISAMNDSVRILKVEVQYLSGRSDSIDLSQDQQNDDRFGRFDRFERRGIRLGRYESTRWLNLNDVVDGMDSGRCIDKIRITGMDTPDNRFERRFGFNASPATVQVEGLIKVGFRPMHRDHDGWDRHDRNDRDGRWDRPDYRPDNRPDYRPDFPRHDEPRMPPPMPAFFIGSMEFSIWSSDNEGFENRNVNGPVKGMELEAKNGEVYVKFLEIKCKDGSVCYSETFKENISLKRVMFSRPLEVASVRGKGTGGTLKISLIK